MMEEQKIHIRSLRMHGLSYRQIAGCTGATIDAIRYQCRDITPEEGNGNTYDKIQKHEACAYCGENIPHQHMGRPKRFCCEKCRRSYWKVHREELEKKPNAVYTKVCPYCGKTFEVYGNRRRKYCSHEHYILDYFGTHKYKEESARSA